jgi:predicted DNA-binding transcriptional regulator AlpA
MSLSPTPTAAAAPRRRKRDTSSFGRGPDDKLVSIPEFGFVVGECRSSVYQGIKDGRFSTPVKTGPSGKNSRLTLGEARRHVAKLLSARG